MSEHYFTENPTAASRPCFAQYTVNGQVLRFKTDAGVFSRGVVDRGSRVLFEALPQLCGDVLDLGCGYGFLGLAIARANPGCRVVMADVNRRALELAQYNARSLNLPAQIVHSDGFSSIDGAFDHIITNPPVNAGKGVYYPWFAQSCTYLKPAGAFYCVLLKKHGALSAKAHLQSIFMQVDVLEKSGGIYVLKAQGVQCPAP